MPVDHEYNAMLHAVAKDHDDTPKLALADMMEDKGRPGAHLLRAGVAADTINITQQPYMDDRGTNVYLGHGTTVGFQRGVGVMPNHHLWVQHQGDQEHDFQTLGDDHPKPLIYSVPVTSIVEAAPLMADWPVQARALIAHAMRNNGVPVKPAATKLARMRAPAGGIIVNNVYQRGGQFMAKAFKRIRDVASRLVKLARKWDSDTPGYVYADALQEDGKPGAHIARASDDWSTYHTGGRARELDRVAHVDMPDHVVNVWHSAPFDHRDLLAPFYYVNHTTDSGPNFHVKLRSVKHLSALLADYPQADRIAMLRAAHAHGLPLHDGPVKLARPTEQTATLPGSAFAGSDPVRPLTLGELKQMEDDHGIGQRNRLSPRVVADKPADGDASTFRANKEHVARFLDALTQKRLVGHKLRSALSDPRRTDDQKAAYAALHMAHEAKEFLDATRANGAGEWYGEHVKDLERAVHVAFGAGFEPGSPRQTLFKAVAALSSSGTNPRDNALAAYRMLREGQRRRPDHPFLGVPAYNEPALREWMTRFGDGPTAPGHTTVDENTPPAAEHAWYVKHILPRYDALDNKRVGYQARPAVVVDRPGHPDHGKLVEYNAHGIDHVTPEGGSLYQRHRGKGVLRRVALPVTDEAGRLKPKGWNAQGAQVERGIERLQKLIRTVGEERAAQFLLTPQKDTTFQRLFGYTPDRAQIGTDERLPGAFMFGPKFGAFLLNLHGPEHGKWLTADKWWARSWNRLLGTMLHGAGRGAHVESPRGRAERNLMAQAAREATQSAGLKSVAELQAVMWYYEQSLWRMLGVRQAKSYSFRDGAKAILSAHKAHEDKQTVFPFGYNDPAAQRQRSEAIPLARKTEDTRPTKWGWKVAVPGTGRLVLIPHRPEQDEDGVHRWIPHLAEGQVVSLKQAKKFFGVEDVASLHGLGRHVNETEGQPLNAHERAILGLDQAESPDWRPAHAIPEDYYA